MREISNPFKENATNWAKKAENKYENTSKTDSSNCKNNKKEVMKTGFTGKPSLLNKKKSKHISRVSKSFKIYPGKISKDFNRRVKTLQMNFDDLNLDKEFIDSGKYIMFLMAFAEEHKLYDLYSSPNLNGGFKMDRDKLEDFILKLENY